MKRQLTLSLLLLSLAAGPALAEEAMPYAVKLDRGNTASLQRGARNFMNYCSGCHGMQYLRYNRMAKDLAIPEDVLKKNLMFTSDKVGDQIHSAMPAEKAAEWFGKQPPDLTLETRARGAGWVYNYLLGFYLDPKRPTGVNNIKLANVSMPHVLWELQGFQKQTGEKSGSEGEGEEHKSQFELEQKGALSPEEYQKWVADLVNFMDYAAAPEKAESMTIGVRVLLYLIVFLLPLTYLLKREYWKDVH